DVLDQPEQIGAGWRHRPPDVVLPQAVELGQQRDPAAAQVLEQGTFLVHGDTLPHPGDIALDPDATSGCAVVPVREEGHRERGRGRGAGRCDGPDAAPLRPDRTAVAVRPDGCGLPAVLAGGPRPAAPGAGFPPGRGSPPGGWDPPRPAPR